jgi:uncharacterized membrane protein YccC
MQAVTASRARRWLGDLVRHPEADLSKLPIGLDLHALNLTEGIRAGLSVAVIVALNEWLQWPLLMEAALAAWLACLCDQGGPIRQRLPALLGFTLAGALITAGAGLARNGGLAVAVPLASLGLFSLSLLRIYGQSTLVLGNLLSVVLVLALTEPIDLAEAGLRAAAFVGGGLWATLWTMVVWRIHPYRPVRQSVAVAYRALAALVQNARQLLRVERLHDTAWEEHARAHRRDVREAIEQARGVVMSTIRVRGAGSRRAIQSLIRLEAADQMFGALIALTDLMEGGEVETDPVTIDGVLRRMRANLKVLARAIVADDAKHNPQIQRSLASLAEQLEGLPENDSLRRAGDFIVQRLRIAATLATPVDFLPDTELGGGRPSLTSRIVRPLRANLAWNSLALRHALRVAVCAAPAVAFYVLWAGPYQPWLAITWVLTMQPQFAMTITRALERIGGTVLGGIVAAVIGLVCRTPIAMAAAIFPLAVIALAVRQVSFGLFMAAVTPLVVLLSELNRPETAEWVVAGMRALFTVIGGLFALLGCLFLWPSWEPDRLPGETRAAIKAHARYADVELAAILGEGSDAEVDAARRAAGMASNNLENSLSRALVEPGHPRLEAELLIDAALRRLAGRLSAMQLDPELRRALAPDEWRRWRVWIVDSLEALAAEGPPPILPPRPVSHARAPVPETIARIARQIELMAEALPRLATHAASTGRELQTAG